jgi:hypothetical protein
MGKDDPRTLILIHRRDYRRTDGVFITNTQLVNGILAAGIDETVTGETERSTKGVDRDRPVASWRVEPVFSLNVASEFVSIREVALLRFGLA